MNLTMTMRLESDIPISYMNTDRSTQDVLGDSWDTDGPAPMVPFDERNQSGHGNTALWIAKACHEMSKVGEPPQ